MDLLLDRGQERSYIWGRRNLAMRLSTIFLALAVAASWASAARAASTGTEAGTEPADWDARLLKADGDVTVALAGADEEEAVPAKADMPLSAGDKVLTGPKSRVEVALGPDNLLEVGPESSAIIKSVKKIEAELGLLKGYLVAKMKMLLNQRFQVRSPTAVASVRGTEFAVEVVEGEEESKDRTVVGVFDEGKLGVTSLEDETSTERFLSENQEADFLRGKPPGEPRKLEFLKERAARVKYFRGRMEAVRERFKRFGREERERIRGQMEERRQEIHRRMEAGPEMRPDRLKEMKDKLRRKRGRKDRRP
jgi:hypothetical protein